ncbi:MAG: GDSL-like Lipase/Acylhydrolase [Paenibacillaceae bacterium]|nr:GDSL-like Lipase/Acylhydrolase [Paenibacillaceae bacterium]
MSAWEHKQNRVPLTARILFLGDSVTDNGLYIAYLDAYFRCYHPGRELSLIPLGVSSETASGLSETKHPFPRPCVHDRVEEALQKTTPDWVICCYGMNDGIYHPLSEERLQAYQTGMSTLLQKIKAAGAKAVVLTPPPFDAVSFAFPPPRTGEDGKPDYSYLSPYREYDAVLEAYAQWLLSDLAPAADGVIDIRTPLLHATASQRNRKPGYSSGDGIHPNAFGHGIIARTLLSELFGEDIAGIPDLAAALEHWAGFPLVLQRHRILADAWKEHVGHSHPVKAAEALPLEKALTAARRLEQEIACIGR